MHINPGPEYYTWYNFTNAILLCIGGVVSATCWWLKQLALPLMVTNAMDDDDLQQFMASVSSSRWFDSVFLVNFHGWQCKWPALSSLCGSQGHWTCWISHFKWSKMTWLLSSFRFSASQKWRRLQWKSKKSQRKKTRIKSQAKGIWIRVNITHLSASIRFELDRLIADKVVGLCPCRVI